MEMSMKRRSKVIATALAAIMAAATLGFASSAEAQGWGMMGGYGPGYYGHMGYGRGYGPRGMMRGYGPGYRWGGHHRGDYGRGTGPGYGRMGGYNCWRW